VVEKEYAKALYELAEEQRIVNVIEEEFNAISNILKDEETMKFFLAPNIKIEDKKSVVLKSFKGFNETLINFLFVLLDNRRFDLVQNINNEFTQIILNKNEILPIKLISAKKLDKNQIDKITLSIRLRFNNKKLKIENIVDETLIGGIKILANDTEIDLSTKKPLKEFLLWQS
jgi:F-type H+-transporting ATPase subunit delta